MSKKKTAKPDASKSSPEAGKSARAPLVTVRVMCAALGENGFTYLKGESFETSAERAAALGDSVQVI